MENKKTISDLLLQHSSIRKANVVAAFYPMKSEPDVVPFLRLLAGEGRLLLPRCGENCTMEFFKVTDLYADLASGAYGIKEPNEACKPWVGNIAVFLVPGVKFDRNGGRKGHGKGYYDRYLAKFPGSLKIGVCNAEQLQEEPLDLKEHDILMDEVISV